MYSNNPLIISQHVDGLKIGCKALTELQLNSFRAKLMTLEKYKEEAQLQSGDSSSRFVTYDLFGCGRFRIFAQGAGVYRFRIENDDFRVLLGDIKLDATRPQIAITFNQSFLIYCGHVMAYNLVKKFVTRVLGDTKDLLTEIHLATDVMNVRYYISDALRFQTHFKKSDYLKSGVVDDGVFNVQLVAKSTLETISIGRNSFLFRIYDKIKELNKKPADKITLMPRWIAGGYKPDSKSSVWRHEIQLRDTHLKRHFSPDCENQVLDAFSKLESFWNYTFTKVDYVALTDNELERISNSTNPHTIKNIYARAKNDERNNPFTVVQSWFGISLSQSDCYKTLKEAQAVQAYKSAKAFVCSSYKAFGSLPSHCSDVLQSVSTELYKQTGKTLHEYASMKLVDSYVLERETILKLGIVMPDFHKDNFHKAQSAFFELLHSIDDKDAVSVLKSKQKYQIFLKD